MKLRKVIDSDVFQIDWWLMNHCNYSCSYCPEILKNSTIGLPDIDHCKNLVDDIQDFVVEKRKKSRYYLTGGEVTRWPWIIELLQHIKSHKSTVGIRSNGSMPISEWSLLCDNLDFVNLEVHSEYTQLGHFMMCLHVAKKRNLNVSISVNMLIDRWQELEEIIEKIKKQWPYQIVNKKMLFEDPARNTKPKPYDNIQKDKLKGQKGDLIYSDKDGNEEITDYQTLLLENKNVFKGQQCQAGIEQLIIDAWGSVFRGHCRQGGLIGKLGHGFKPPDKSIRCHADACSNGFDILSTKF